MDGTEVKLGKVRSGYPALESLMNIGCGIVTIRCAHPQWLFDLSASIMVRNYSEGKRTLYLSWADYHERYWTFNYDRVLSFARKARIDTAGFSDSLHIMRAFCRDNNEVEGNWAALKGCGKFDLILLDSIGELYSERKEGSKAMTYSIGKFAQLCIRNDCVGVVLDRCERPLHNYLAHVSSVIIELGVSREVSLSLIKHPCMADISESFPRDGQYRLVRWL